MTIHLEHVSKSYHDTPVLQDISLSFNLGRHYCLMGPSGLGKTTLLYLLIGLLQPDSGTISTISPQEIATVFQEDRLCENLSVHSNLRLICTEKEQMKQASSILDQLMLPNSLKKPVNQLSGGMKRRVALARSIISNRSIMIWDEPFKGLDSATRSAVIAYLKQACHDKTVIWVTHDIQEYHEFGGELIRLDSLASLPR